MTYDFNDASESQSVGSALIPPHSVVMCRIHVNTPKNGRELEVAQSGLQGVSVDLEVTVGRFAGKRMRFQNLWLQGGTTDGHRKACAKGRAQCRAILEYARNVLPTDQSPTAVEARRMSSPFDLDGMLVPVEVTCESSGKESKNRPGYCFVNNVMNRIIRRVDPEHAMLEAGGGEHITDEPIPEFPCTAARGQEQGTSWGAPAAPQAAPAVQQAPWGQATHPAAAPSAVPTPSWGGQPAQAPAPQQWTQQQTPVQTPPPPMFPSESVDSVPF